MKCFVTGAGGFIGRHLCHALQERGDSVTAGLRSRSAGPWSHVLINDLAYGVPSPAEIDGIDCVFHLAGKAHGLSEYGQDEDAYFRINVEATRNLLESCRAAAVRRFVFISSVKAAGESGAVALDETTASRPDTPYGSSKLEAEQFVLHGGYVPEPVVLRPTMVYGPTRKGNLPRMIEAVAKGRFPPLQEMGNKRSMVHVEDVVQAALLVMEKPAAVGQAYIVTDGQVYSTRQIYIWICDVLDKPVPAWTIPISMLKVLAKLGDCIGLLRNRRFMFDSDALDKLTGSAVYSSAKIQCELDFHADWNLRAALPEIVAYLRLKR